MSLHLKVFTIINWYGISCWINHFVWPQNRDCRKMDQQSIAVLGQLSFSELYSFILKLNCFNELKFYLTCEAAHKFNSVESGVMSALYSNLFISTATFTVLWSVVTGVAITSIRCCIEQSSHGASGCQPKMIQVFRTAQFKICSSLLGHHDLNLTFDLVVNSHFLMTSISTTKSEVHSSKLNAPVLPAVNKQFLLLLAILYTFRIQQ